MDDDLISFAEPTKGGSQKATEHRPGDKSREKRQNKVAPFQARKPIGCRTARWFARLSPVQWTGFGTHVIVTVWLWIYLVESHDFTHLVGFFICLLIAYTVALYFLFKLLRGTVLPISVVCALATLTGGVLYKNSQVRTVQQPPPTIVAVPQPDYIEGTKFTREQMDDFFPFGYTVFLSKDRRLSYEVHKNDLMEWNIDLRNVKIEPDFGSNTVVWTIPQFPNTNNVQPFRDNSFFGNTFGKTTPFRIGAWVMRATYMGNNYVGNDQACMFLGVLSDNQERPVFVIGYRMMAREEIMRRNYYDFDKSK